MFIAFRYVIAAAVAHASLASAVASAQVLPPQPLKPFRPVQVINTDDYICDYFRGGWESVFDGKGPLREDTLNLERTFPRMNSHTRSEGSRGGFYNTSQPVVLDFDGDGSKEVLLIDSYDIGWRYLGVALYLFNSETDYEKAQQSPEHMEPWGLSLDRAGDKRVAGINYRLLAEFGPVSALPIVQNPDNGRVYTYKVSTGPSEDEPQTAELIHLNAIGGPKAVCTVDVMPAKSTLAHLRDTSRVFSGLKAVRGSSEGCNGTLGWRAAAIDDRLPSIVYRPWAIPKYPAGETDDERTRARRADAGREVRYLSWGLSDPRSWQDYLDIKQGRGSLTGALEDHYLAHYTAFPDVAEQMSDNAWRWLLDGVIYGRNGDEFSLVQMTGYGGVPDLSISISSTPSTVSRITVDAWLASLVTAEANNQKPVLATNALLASIYGGADIHRINSILDARKRVLSETSNVYKAGLTQALLAALTHEDRRIASTIIRAGADANARTNWFGKTPLMYAAQMNSLGGVYDLLGHGKADVNLSTDGAQNKCMKLQRDHRTALMYAAENASFDVIKVLIEAGADSTKKDTAGNTAAWYFQRNAVVVDPEERARVTKRLAAQ